jgi:hypothetical protein
VAANSGQSNLGETPGHPWICSPPSIRCVGIRAGFTTLEAIRNGFRNFTKVCVDRAVADNRRAIIHDYNHVEFIDIPLRRNPSQKLMFYSAPQRPIPTTAIALIRHPTDQRASLCEHVDASSIPSPAAFCDSYAAFLRELGSTREFKHEDFVAIPKNKCRSSVSTHLKNDFIGMSA